VGIYPLRAYADTSVFGGVFDEEFRESTRRFFDEVVEGRFELVTSTVVAGELAPAPAQVRDFAEEMLPWTQIVGPSRSAAALQEAYIAAGVLPRRWATDALHVSIATVESCALIVSWNFAHHVNVDRIRGYCAVNALEGYGPIDIRTPAEVVRYEEDL
jgi:predicted nucleic acid-binding protein